MATFPPVTNPLPFGPPVIEAVPDSVRAYHGQLFVTLLRGFPFVPGFGAVVTVDPTTGSVAPLISGLASAIDVLPVKTKGATSYLTLEISTDFLASQPGRLQRFATPAGPGIVISSCLDWTQQHGARRKDWYALYNVDLYRPDLSNPRAVEN